MGPRSERNRELEGKEKKLDGSKWEGTMTIDEERDSRPERVENLLGRV